MPVNLGSGAGAGAGAGGGALNNNYSLPFAPALTFSSDKALATLLDEIRTVLARGKMDEQWDQRMNALKKMEGLVHGGATSMPCFTGSLRAMRDALLEQLDDRRSAIVRQTCHLLAVLAADLGRSIESFIEPILPALFSVAKISILIMSDSADAAVKEILANCPSSKLLARVMTAAASDRSTKLRTYCAEHVCTCLSSWDASHVSPRIAEVEETVLKNCRDAQAEVRAAGRRCYGVLAQGWPASARRLLSKCDPSLQRALQEAASAAPAARGGSSAAASAAPSARSSSSASSARSGSSVAATSAPSARVGGSATAGAPRRMAVPTRESSEETSRSSSRDAETMGGISVRRGAVRAPVAVRDSQDGGGAHVSHAPPAGLSAARRVKLDVPRRVEPATAPAQPKKTAAVAVSGATAPAPNSASEPRRPASASSTQAQRAVPEPAASVPVAQPPPQQQQQQLELEQQQQEMARSPEENVAAGLATLASPPGTLDWSSKVAAILLLREAVPLLDDPTADADAVLEMAIAHVSDAHVKVSAASLELLAATLPVSPSAALSNLDNLLPPLFVRLVDTREAVRTLSASALDGVLEATRGGGAGPALVSSLLASLDAMRVPKGKLAVLEFAIRALRPESGAAGSLRPWVSRVAPLVADKNASLRAAATASLVNLHENVDADSVLGHLASSPVAEAASLVRAMSPHIFDLSTRLQSYKQKMLAPTQHVPSVPAAPSSVAAEPAVVVAPAAAVSAPAPAASQPPSRSLSPLENAASGHDAELSRLFADVSRDPSRAHEALAKLANMAHAARKVLRETGKEAPWVARYFTQTVSVSVDQLGGHARAVTRELALLVLRELAVASPTTFATQAMELTLPRILRLSSDRDVHVAAASEETAESLVGTILSLDNADSRNHLLSILVAQLPERGESANAPAHLPRVVSLISQLCKSMGTEALMEATPRVLPGLFESFHSPVSDVRKSVVFCLVDMYCILRDWLWPHLAPLTTSQMKLVSIYISRRREAAATKEDTIGGKTTTQAEGKENDVPTTIVA
ncbi:CLIP-associated protein [Pycnococcus provasolii]